MKRFGIIKEFWEFVRERKRWWLAPILIFLVLLGCLLVFAKGSALAPFIYSLF
jgi:cell division protein FtsB